MVKKKVTRNLIIYSNIEDWSPIDFGSDIPKDEIWSEIEKAGELEQNFFIYKEKENLRTKGYIGVGRLFDKNGHVLITEGKENIIMISPRFEINPWEMLKAVMEDEEFDDYIIEMEKNSKDKNPKFLYKVFYDQPLIKLPQDSDTSGEILLALGFVSECFRLCKKGLKKNMTRNEYNYTAKIRGRIDVKKNIRENTFKGHNERFYCNFITFTEDNTENRILKAALIKSKKIIGKLFRPGTEIPKRLAYCMNTLQQVKSVQIKASDFNRTDTSGLYTYYKPSLQMAKCLCSQKGFSYKDKDGIEITKNTYTVPHMINMEMLFEFYARSVLKKAFALSESKFNEEEYYLKPYSDKIYLQKGISNEKDAEEKLHLIKYCIPDIIICKKDTDKKENMIVLDVKYKRKDTSSRSDSHQLLSYVLLTGTDACGFILPDKITHIRPLQTVDHSFLPLSTGNQDNTKEKKYYEIMLSSDVNNIEDIKDILNKILESTAP